VFLNFRDNWVGIEDFAAKPSLGDYEITDSIFLFSKSMPQIQTALVA
jgi:hypothetical protein